MVENFTPIDVTAFEQKDSKTNVVLLLVATITAFILALMLFILIQKKMGHF